MVFGLAVVVVVEVVVVVVIGAAVVVVVDVVLVLVSILAFTVEVSSLTGNIGLAVDGSLASFKFTLIWAAEIVN